MVAMIRLLFLLALPLAAAEFKSEKDCQIGAPVADRQNRQGKITAVKTTMCEVTFPDNTKQSYLFWMLHPAGSSAETDDKLTPGIYKCTGSLKIEILSANTYENVGKRGTFHIEPSRKIVFENGPLASYTAKLLAGPTIGLNANGSNYFGITCRLPR